MNLPFQLPLAPKAEKAVVQTLQPYGRDGVLKRHRKLALTTLGLLSLLYGAFFSLTTTYFLVPMLVPLVVIMGLIVWCLPETGYAPRRLVEHLFFSFLIALLCWPDYLALALPGLPWITAIRLIIGPLTIVFTVGLSQSQKFRADLIDIIEAVPVVWKLVFAFSVVAFLSVGFSSNIGMSLNKFIVAMLYWVIIFFVACYTFSLPGRVSRLAHILWAVTILVCLIAIPEARHSAVPWAGHIPSFLKIENPAVEKILAGSARAATGIYRVQSKFTTALGLAEFLVYALPFIIHLSFMTHNVTKQAACVLTLPLVLWTIVKTDSRLGMVGFFVTLLLYILFWGVRRWRDRKDSLFGPAAVLAFPGLGVAFLLASFWVGRVRALIWGSGAQSYSSDARKQQVAEGLPMIWSHPWGHGFGRGAETLGFSNGSSDTLTIDSYYLAVALEIGVVGFFVYFGIFVYSILFSAKYVVIAKPDETSFLGPCVIVMINYVIIKSIFSQLENQPLLFALLGACVAIIYRLQRGELEKQAAI